MAIPEGTAVSDVAVAAEVASASDITLISTISAALVAGFVFRRLGFPPLLGYLAAGFIGHALELGDAEQFDTIANLGITLLLFTIGLKLNVKTLASPPVWGVASLHMIIVIPLTTALIWITSQFFPPLAITQPETAWILAFALSFSSTVFAIKAFEERGETISLHATIAIGILVLQDLVAVTFIVLSADTQPNWTAFGLLLLPALRWVLLPLLRHIGHGELLVLLGFTAALCGYALFESVHLKGGLGAIALGMLFGGTEKTTELYKAMMPFKDLFLVGFFLQIGYYGIPSLDMVWVVLALGILLFLRPLIYFTLFLIFRLRARTAFYGGMALFNYSEFGLIVATMAVADGLLPREWVTVMALSLAVSFFIGTPFNSRAHGLFRHFRQRLVGLESLQPMDEDRYTDVAPATVLVVGMGRVGVGAYRHLSERYPQQVLGIEESQEKTDRHQSHQIACIHGDGTDRDFWERSHLENRQLIFISLSNHHENVSVVKLLQQLGFSGTIAVVSRFPDEKRELETLGCVAFDLYAEAGYGFSEHVLNKIGEQKVQALKIAEKV